MYLSPTIDFPEIPAYPRAAFDFVVVVVMIAVAILTRLHPTFAPLAQQKWAMPAALVLLEVCTFVSFFAVILEVTSPVLTWILLAAGAAGMALMMLLLSEFFGFIHPRRTVLYIAWSWLVGSICVVFIRALPLLYVWACMVVVPIVVALCLWRSYHTLSASELSFMTSRRLSFPWLPIVPVILCAVVKRGINVLVPTSVNSQAINDAGMTLAALAILAGLMAFQGNLNLRSLWKVAVGGMAASVLLFVVAVGGNMPLVGSGSAVLSTMSYQILFLLMTAIFANMAYRYGVCALWLFSIEHAANMFAGASSEIGMGALIRLFPDSLPVLDGTLVVASIVFLIVVAMLFNRFSPDSLWRLSLDDEGSFSESERLHLVSEQLIADGGLTQREGEILFMCMQGKKPVTIAKELFIEVSTTRTHIKHIYSKLGVHSRMELAELIESRKERAGVRSE